MKASVKGDPESAPGCAGIRATDQDARLIAGWGEESEKRYAGVDPWELAASIVWAGRRAEGRRPQDPGMTVVVPRECIGHVQRFVEEIRMAGVIGDNVTSNYSADLGNEGQVVYQFGKEETGP